MPFQRRGQRNRTRAMGITRANTTMAQNYDLAALLSGYQGAVEVITPGGDRLLVECAKGHSIVSIRPFPWGVRPIVNAEELAHIATAGDTQTTPAGTTQA